VLEVVAAAVAAGEAGGEDHAVVGQRGGRNAMGGTGFAEGGTHDRAGDAAVGGDREGIAGVVVEAVEDLDMAAISKPPVGEVGLPAFVGLFGGKTDVGGLGTLLGLRGDQPGRLQVAVDGGRRHRQPVVVLQVPGQGMGAMVEPFAELLVA
jgi:hypothetical protein